MKKIFNKLLASGIWLQPFIMLGLVAFLKKIKPHLLLENKTWLLCLVISFIPTLFIWSASLSAPKEEAAMSGKHKAMYPPISKNFLYKEPVGIILGKDKRSGMYVCKPLHEDGHIFVIGGSGSGKSSCLVIPALLINKGTRVFAVDIKGELSFKTARYGDKNILIFNPSDRFSYGYDPLYSLSEDSSTQEILEVMQNISFSLISLPANLKDPFWKVSARNLFTGLLIYYYKQGIADLVSIIDEILGRPVRDSIDDVMANAKKDSAEYRYIVQFSDMEDETLGGIVAEINNHIVVFANDQDVRFAFKENGCKLNPAMLEDGYSIYLSIKEEKLSAYYDVMQLIINQTVMQLEKRPENSAPIIVCIDELPRILSAGKLDRLLDGARTLRSRNVCLFLITQSTEALMSAYTENEVTDLISNCTYIVVLSASSMKTQKMVCAWCGKYMVKKQSWSGSGKDRKVSVSYEEKDIVDSSDLMTLPQSGEAILITPYGYSRVRKVPYYSDKFLSPMAEEIIDHNKVISGVISKNS